MTAPAPESRVVPCLTCPELVRQTLDSEGVFRPKPALCDACQARNAERAVEWLNDRRRRIEAVLAGAPRIVAEDLTSWSPAAEAAKETDRA